MSLLSIPSVFYRWLAVAALVASFGAVCWFKGDEHGSAKLTKAQIEAMKQGEKIIVKRGEVTTQVETEFVPVLQNAQVITRTIIKEVPVYVPTTDPDLSGGFRVLHDAAAAGVLPDRASIPHAAPVPAQDAASTVTENYGICRENAIRLEGLQKWVRAQGAVK